MELIGMTDFVLQRSKKSISEMTILETFKDGAKITNEIFNYANFLKQPLTLGMFISCVDNEPFNYSIHGNKEHIEKAKERVLFEGFNLIGEDKEQRYYNLELQNMNIWICFFKGDADISTRYFSEIPIKTIEDLVSENLTLTESALKQLGL